MGLPLDAGYNAIYTCMDNLTKAIKIFPCVVGDGGLQAPATVKLFFDHIIYSYGVSYMVLHDRDPRFTSSFGTALLEFLGNHVVFSTAFYLQKNS